MKILITGGTGFIGRHLVHLLHQEGHEVTVLHRASSCLNGLPESISTRLGDVTRAETLKGCCEGIDWVFHVAGDVTWGKKLKSRMFEINVMGSRNIAQEALKSGVKRFIHTSSAAAVGLPRERVIDEDEPFNGDQLQVEYSIAKRRGEEAVLDMVPQGLPAVVVNPTVVIGVQAAASSFFNSVVDGKLTLSPSGGVNICDVEDIAQGHRLAAEYGKIGERYLLGGENLPMIELFQRLADASETHQKIRSVPSGVLKVASLLAEGISILNGKEPIFAWDLAKLAGRNIYYSSAKAEQELGYTITPLEQTIKKIVEERKTFR
ncbi:NAD-dependent epimerase/dehydratase family protein [Hazenella coriacea]|uniref:Dihydroflavonol-4-reductase n=1 Tax=Hazenella coriacea TaxID=1179467 RepID=A0A4R3LB52_9BACL|nr:NAD-dependent epimerase/dehydratase family protein [Hazenella coriacea]TCS96420.1 dihydroflavonol-4-reductase [Hazenella coriacea]